MKEWFAWLLAVSTISAATEASAQYRFDAQVYRDWADAANGQPCETQLEGSFVGSRSPSEYPPAALEFRTSGEVLLTFDTNYSDGTLSIENARVFASEPSGVFDQTALAIAREFRFPPTMRNCQGLRTILWFEANNANPERVMQGIISPSLASPPLRPETARALREGRLAEHCQIEGGAINSGELGQALMRFYPQRAMERDREGMAVVQFSIAPDGTVLAPVTIEEFPVGWGFGEAGTQAMQVARYPPRAEACDNAATTVRFILQ